MNVCARQERDAAIKRMGGKVPSRPLSPLMRECLALNAARHITSAPYLAEMERSLAECEAELKTITSDDKAMDLRDEIADLRAGIAVAKASRKGL